MKITDKTISIIGNTFKDEEPRTVRTKPCCIKFNGKFITTKSKKTVWRNIGFAKSAFISHIKSSGIRLHLAECLGLKDDYRYCFLKDLVKELQELKVLEFVEVDNSTFAVQKK